MVTSMTVDPRPPGNGPAIHHPVKFCRHPFFQVRHIPTAPPARQGWHLSPSWVPPVGPRWQPPQDVSGPGPRFYRCSPSACLKYFIGMEHKGNTPPARKNPSAKARWGVSPDESGQAGPVPDQYQKRMIGPARLDLKNSLDSPGLPASAPSPYKVPVGKAITPPLRITWGHGVNGFRVGCRGRNGPEHHLRRPGLRLSGPLFPPYPF